MFKKTTQQNQKVTVNRIKAFFTGSILGTLPLASSIAFALPDTSFIITGVLYVIIGLGGARSIIKFLKGLVGVVTSDEENPSAKAKSNEEMVNGGIASVICIALFLVVPTFSSMIVEIIEEAISGF